MYASDEATYEEEPFNVDKYTDPEYIKKKCEELDLNSRREFWKDERKRILERTNHVLNNDLDVIILFARDFRHIKDIMEQLGCPLGQLQEEVTRVLTRIKNTQTNLAQLIRDLEENRSANNNATREINIMSEVEKTYTLINNFSEKATDDESAMVWIERLADQNLVNFPDHVFYSEFSKELRKIVWHINCLLKDQFLNAVRYKDYKKTMRALHVYLRLGYIREAETILQEQLVHVYLKDILCQKYLKQENNNLKKVFDDAIKVSTHYFKELITMVQSNRDLKVFDFGSRSIYTEFFNLISKNLKSIAAPGDPQIFHDNFECCMNLIIKFRDFISARNRRTFDVIAFQDFLEMFNLDVYFSIREVEIRALFEKSYVSAVEPTFSEDMIVKEDEREQGTLIFEDKTVIFDLHPTAQAFRALVKCFDTSVHLQFLQQRFSLLHCELFLKFDTWLQRIINSFLNGSLSDQSAVSYKNLTETANRAKFKNRLQMIIYMYKDVLSLIELYNYLYTSSHIAKSMPICDEYSEKVKKLLDMDIDYFICYMYAEIEQVANRHVEKVKEIPRLFRRTNRPHPTKASEWVLDTFQPLQIFTEEYKHDLQEAHYNQIVEHFITSINAQIFKEVENLVKSIGATEKSLRRFKAKRNVEPSSSGDDEKIREQLRIDILTYVTEAKKFSVDVHHLPAYEELLNHTKTIP